MPLPGGDTSDQMSSWPDILPLLATKCLYQGYIWPKVGLTQRMTKCQLDLTYYHSWPLNASTRGTSDQKSVWPKGWPNVNLTWHITNLGHQMPLLWVHLTKGQPYPEIWQKVSTWPKASSMGGLSDLSAKRISENFNTLYISCFAS